MSDTLDEAARLAERARRVLALRDQAIVRASKEGATLRAIAAAVGLTHTGVARVLDRAVR